MEKIKVIIVEDHKMFREVIAERIKAISSRIEIIGASGNGIELMEELKKNIPDIILLDLNMPEMDGWKVLEILKSDYPNIKTIIFSGDFQVSFVSHAIIAGASAFIDKLRSDEKDIVAAIENVFEYDYYFNDIVSQDIILTLKHSKKIPALQHDDAFSERERQVIEQICEGKQVKEIAASLHLSQGAVKYHKDNLFKKTKTNTNLDLVKYAISRGIFNVFETKTKKKG